MQKITDKQFILSVFIQTIFKIDFYQTKIERKLRVSGRKFRENEVENTSKFEIRVNFERKLTNFFRKFSRISFNENFDGNSTPSL